MRPDLGGDEVNTACWGKVPAIKAWLAAHNMTEDDGYAYFVKRVAQIAIDQGRRPVQWVEVFDHFGTKLVRADARFRFWTYSAAALWHSLPWSLIAALRVHFMPESVVFRTRRPSCTSGRARTRSSV